MKYILFTLLLGFFLGLSLRIPLSRNARSKSFEKSSASSELFSSVLSEVDSITELPNLNVWMSMFSNGAISGVSLNQNDASSDAVQGGISRPAEQKIPLISNILRLPEFDHEENLPALPVLGAWRAAVMTGGIDLPPSIEAFLSKSVDLQPQHEEQVLSMWANLKKRASVSSFNDEEKERVIESLRIAYVTLYGKTTWRSAEVAFNRAHGTAAVLGEMRASANVVIAGILHAVFVDTTAPIGARVRAELVSRFGADVINLVEQYARLPRFMTATADYSTEPMQAENQVQMLVAGADSFNALLIRIASRLHNMRVLPRLPLSNAEQIKIAEEALYVYAPLAHKMGLVKIKGELEDLAFRTMDPVMFKQTRYTQTTANKAFHEAAETIDALVDGDAFMASQRASCKLTYRIKGKYQLFLKMKRKNLKSLSDVRDALGLRLIIRTPSVKGETSEQRGARGKALCYHLVERLRSMPGWTPCERGFKDYIAQPKANGYESLHQYIRNDALGTNVEVQVRTLAMHSAAELGEAAHWFYKDLVYRKEVANSKLYRVAWRSPLQAKASSPAEMLAMARRQLNDARVFVYLNDRSQVLNLRTQATALDAAFSIHSDVGLSTVAVKVNGKRVALNRVLVNGDVINVERAPEGVVTVMPSWLYLSKCPNTHAVIRKFFRDHRRDRLVCEGLVQLMASLAMSKAAVEEKFSGKLPSVGRVASLVKNRSVHSDLSSFLLSLGSASRSDARNALARVLGVPVDALTVPSVPAAVAWARSQQKSRWLGQEALLDMQQVLLRELLPEEGLPLAELRWLELVGAVDSVCTGSGSNCNLSDAQAVGQSSDRPHMGSGSGSGSGPRRMPFVTRGSLSAATGAWAKPAPVTVPLPRSHPTTVLKTHSLTQTHSLGHGPASDVLAEAVQQEGSLQGSLLVQQQMQAASAEVTAALMKRVVVHLGTY